MAWPTRTQVASVSRALALLFGSAGTVKNDSDGKSVSRHAPHSTLFLIPSIPAISIDAKVK